ncbi:MAG: hypothetical protein K6F83_06310 [Clostridiales bacterium]|nr:hypothetical protein [Clostridiales bacterium]
MDSYSMCICPDSCPYIDSCENKMMAHEGLLDPPMLEPVTVDAIQPLLEPVIRETMEINVYGTRMTVYKDEIERMIYEPLTRHFGLMSGA